MRRRTSPAGSNNVPGFSELLSEHEFKKFQDLCDRRLSFLEAAWLRKLFRDTTQLAYRKGRDSCQIPPQQPELLSSPPTVGSPDPTSS